MNNNTNTISITFLSKQKNIQGNNNTVILNQGEKAGLILPHSCLRGQCGRCKAKLISGEVKQLKTDGLTTAEQENNYILLCSCIPLTDVVIKHES
ncbi:2Fe-2S iron-sulfur cluster-binding protein [Litorilituus lipolyticus]|uniref:2Fe-2S iron-sulfur cluster binding domain-containing protein n=1 Tax=Litorilituus lipolyticus TaxID=2491017 RepID=A0A502L712_9GAMM|nr:2Fe-2S iron-sulfur cluster-binding protein [Litorilituus lipolyticus]TPH16127.1 2Fe-2S iron-sulfur cluster binding domain-containing protein [Litorilituus lipolyticus]